MLLLHFVFLLVELGLRNDGVAVRCGVCNGHTHTTDVQRGQLCVRSRAHLFSLLFVLIRPGLIKRALLAALLLCHVRGRLRRGTVFGVLGGFKV